MSGLHDPRSEALASIGRASIMVHDHGGGNPTYEGSFTLDGVTHHILTKTHYDKVRTAEDVEAALGDMVVFRDQDMHENQPANTTTGCSHDLLEANLFKRDDIAGGVSGGNNYINSIGNPAGCPDSQKLLYMGVALDCNYVSTYSSPSDARTQVLNNWNQASALYKSTFNVSLGIVELQVQNQTCGTTAPSDAQFDVSCDAGLTMDQRLSLFSQWRGDRSNDGIGLWHLMSACPTVSLTVGLGLQLGYRSWRCVARNTLSDLVKPAERVVRFWDGHVDGIQDRVESDLTRDWPWVSPEL